MSAGAVLPRTRPVPLCFVRSLYLSYSGAYGNGTVQFMLRPTCDLLLFYDPAVLVLKSSSVDNSTEKSGKPNEERESKREDTHSANGGGKGDRE